jgi:hypothetical protein
MAKKAAIPFQPHPDVAIVRSLLAEIKPGEIMPYDKVAASISMTPKHPAFYSRHSTARNQLRRQGINIVVVPGEGFLRETTEQTLARHQGRERASMHRKARKAGESLATVDASTLTQEKQAEFFAERTINNVVYVATGSQARQKMLAAAKVATAEIPMAKALEVLQNGRE